MWVESAATERTLDAPQHQRRRTSLARPWRTLLRPGTTIQPLSGSSKRSTTEPNALDLCFSVQVSKTAWEKRKPAVQLLGAPQFGSDALRHAHIHLQKVVDDGVVCAWGVAGQISEEGSRVVVGRDGVRRLGHHMHAYEGQVGSPIVLVHVSHDGFVHPYLLGPVAASHVLEHVHHVRRVGHLGDRRDVLVSMVLKVLHAVAVVSMAQKDQGRGAHPVAQPLPRLMC